MELNDKCTLEIHIPKCGSMPRKYDNKEFYGIVTRQQMSAIGRFTQSDDLEMINKMFYVFCIIPGMPGTLNVSSVQMEISLTSRPFKQC